MAYEHWRLAWVWRGYSIDRDTQTVAIETNLQKRSGTHYPKAMLGLFFTVLVVVTLSKPLTLSRLLAEPSILKTQTEITYISKQQRCNNYLFEGDQGKTFIA